MCPRKNTPAESEEEESSGDEHEDGLNKIKSKSKQKESELERVEKILAVRNNEDGTKEQFFVKYKGTAKPYPCASCVPDAFT